MRIVIAGGSGLIGTALTDALRQQGHDVTALVRRPAAGVHEVQWDPANGQLAPAALDGADAVINLAGAGIGAKRWTENYKKTVLDSRVQTTGLLARTMAGLAHKPSVFLSGSAIGYYGDTGERSVDESATPGNGFLAEVCQQWEAATEPAASAGVRVVYLRTGIVLSPHGGALKQQLLPAKLGLSGRLGSGRQYQSWITLDDEVAAIIFLLAADVSGPVNLTAPNPVPQATFAKTLGRVLHRPAVAPIPAFAVRALFDGFADEGILVGQRVQPGYLQSAGFPFTSTDLADALTTLLR